MPTIQAVQVFYGTVPLILVLLGIWLREQMLLKDILSRLGRIEDRLGRIENLLGDHDRRITTLEAAKWH